MKKLVLSTITVLFIVSTIAAETIDPVPRKYRGRLDAEVKRHKREMDKIRLQMIKDYEVLLKSKLKRADLEGANSIKAKIDALKEQEEDIGIPKGPLSSSKKKLIIWNQHNGGHNDRGTDTCNIILYSGNKVKWEKKDVKVPWKKDKDEKIEVQLPSVSFDRIRIEVSKCVGASGGLAEVELMQGKNNLVKRATVSDSGSYDNKRFTPDKIKDGIKTSKDSGKGYWLLKKKTGWIDLKFKNYIL